MAVFNVSTKAIAAAIAQSSFITRPPLTTLVELSSVRKAKADMCSALSALGQKRTFAVKIGIADPMPVTTAILV